MIRVGAMTKDVQYDGYFRFDINNLHYHISNSSEIVWARLYVKKKERFRGSPSITIECRRIKKEFNPGSGDGSDSTSSEVDWLDAEHDITPWERHWQTRNDKEYIVQDSNNMDSTADWFIWDIDSAVDYAFNDDDIVKVKLERERETISGVWDFYSNEDVDDSTKPYLEIFFSLSSSSSSSSSNSSSSSSST